MEGLVTIRLKDYEELKNKADEYDKNDSHYLRLAVEYVELFEEVESFLKVEHGCMDHPTLLRRVDEVLLNWYG